MELNPAQAEKMISWFTADLAAGRISPEAATKAFGNWVPPRNNWRSISAPMSRNNWTPPFRRRNRETTSSGMAGQVKT
jgi:hypothetical protein